MAEIYYNTALLSKLIKAPDFPEADRQDLAQALAGFQLAKWEDNLLYQLFFTNISFADSEAENIKILYNILRGVEKVAPFSFDDSPGIDLHGKLADPIFQQRLIKTLYYAINSGNASLAMRLRLLIEPSLKQWLSEAGGVFKGVEPQLRLEYEIIYVILCGNFFNFLPYESILFFFSQHYYYYALKIGFNLEEILKNYFSREISFYRRDNQNLELAALISESDLAMGIKNDGTPATAEYWVSAFRAYSNKNFGATELFKFISDDYYFAKCEAAEKENIRKFLELYVHLINGFLILPDSNPETMDRIIAEMANKKSPDYYDIKQYFEDKFKKDAAGQFENVEEIFASLYSLAERYNDRKIAELYFWDEKSNAFKWFDE